MVVAVTGTPVSLPATLKLTAALSPRRQSAPERPFRPPRLPRRQAAGLAPPRLSQPKPQPGNRLRHRPGCHA